jgi:hypothetical protein
MRHLQVSKRGDGLFAFSPHPPLSCFGRSNSVASISSQSPLPYFPQYICALHTPAATDMPGKTIDLDLHKDEIISLYENGSTRRQISKILREKEGLPVSMWTLTRRLQ